MTAGNEMAAVRRSFVSALSPCHFGDKPVLWRLDQPRLCSNVLESSGIAVASAVAIAIPCKQTFLSPSNGFGLRYVGPQPFQCAHSLGQILWAFERSTTFHGNLSGNRSSSDEFIA
jgi:hypothetical protein